MNSFLYCKNLRTVEFQKNSKIQIIDDETFFASSIKKIIIPKEVTKICYKAFFSCNQLESVIFEENSKLRSIEAKAFDFSAIKCLCITSKDLVYIAEDAFLACPNLLIVEMTSIENVNSFETFQSYSNFILMINNEGQINKH